MLIVFAGSSQDKGGRLHMPIEFIWTSDKYVLQNVSSELSVNLGRNEHKLIELDAFYFQTPPNPTLAVGKCFATNEI